MPRIADLPSLLSAVRGWELKAHNRAHAHRGFTKGLEHEAEERAYKRVGDYIERMMVRQNHPHLDLKMRGKITEEFDVR